MHVRKFLKSLPQREVSLGAPVSALLAAVIMFLGLTSGSGTPIYNYCSGAAQAFSPFLVQSDTPFSDSCWIGGTQRQDKSGDNGVVALVDNSSSLLLENPYAGPVSVSDEFTALLPISDGRMIYVASNGSDSNPGTQDAPVQSLEKAESLIRDNSADWILLRAGDTFSGGFGYFDGNNRLANEQVVITTYVDENQ